MPDRLLGIGISGLSAAQLGLATTSHNISNVNTPGYSRQLTVQSARTPQYTGSGFVGAGTEVDTVRRQYDQFLEVQVRAAQSEASRLERYRSDIAALDDLLGAASTSLSPAVDDFFRGVQEVAAHPGDAAARQSVLSAGEALAARFRMFDAQIAGRRVEVNRRIESTVGQVNALTSQIASLNDSIALAAARGNGQQLPNDLLDQRDALVRDLSKLVGVTVVPQSDGSYNVFIGTGQGVVVGNSATALVALPDPADPATTQIGLGSPAGTVRLRAADLPSGELGALLAFREQTLDPAQNAIGRMALAIAQSVNDQHRLGQDRNGAPGTDLFSATGAQAFPSGTNAGTGVLTATIASFAQLTASDYRVSYNGAGYQVTRLRDGTVQTFATLPQTVDGVTLAIAGAPAAGDYFLVQPTRAGARDFAVAIADPALVAAAAPMRGAAAVANRGNATISAGSVNAPPPPNANIAQTVTLTFTSPTTFDVTGTGTGNPAGVAYASGGAISYNGWTFSITGTPAAGDTFTVSANASGTGDNRNALALASLQTATLLDGATTTFQGAYATLVSDVGNQARTVDVTLAAQTKLLEEASAARESAAGVNLDEEAASLLRYQQAYQAAAKVMATASTLFDEILAIMR